MPARVLNEFQISSPLGIVHSTESIARPVDQEVMWFVRPHMLSLDQRLFNKDQRSLLVRHQQFVGRSLRTEITMDKSVLVVENAQPLPEKTPVNVEVVEHSLVLFDQESASH